MRIGPMRIFVSVLLVALVLSWAFPSVSKGEGVSMRYRILRDEVLLREPYLVKEGETLYVAPGTRIHVEIEKKADDEGEVQAFLIRGKLIIDGEAQHPVLVTGARGWGEIYMEGALAVVRHARIENASWAFHIHGGISLIEESDISNNAGGIRTYQRGMYIKDCTFTGNGVAIRYWDGGPTVKSSYIGGNRVGVFFRQGSSTALFRNNVIDNREYNLKVGDFATGRPDLRFNFWGSRDRIEIDKKIFDGRDSRVTAEDLSPYLVSPPPLLRPVREKIEGRSSREQSINLPTG